MYPEMILNNKEYIKKLNCFRRGCLEAIKNPKNKAIKKSLKKDYKRYSKYLNKAR